MPDRHARMQEPHRLNRLGTISVAQFMRDYWQRRAVVLRGVIPGFSPVIDLRHLVAWAREDSVDSRLVSSFGGRWAMRRGPIRSFPARSKRGWSLLVQGVDRLHPEARSVLARFRFIPDVRLDDVMISYASDGGGVGPHLDSYDVFLLQARGRRIWRVSSQSNLAPVPGAPLRLVRNFRASERWTLEPGDALYLPPGIAHEGTALGGECMTWSIGFRAPMVQELLEPWFADFAERANVAHRYSDRGQPATRHPARLPAAMTTTLHRELSRVRPRRGDTEQFLLRHGSEPPANVVFDRPTRPKSPIAFRRAAAQHGVTVDLRTRILYSGRTVAINGEIADVGFSARTLFHRLADHRWLDSAALAACEPTTFDQLYGWYCAGWLHCSGAAKLSA